MSESKGRGLTDEQQMFIDDLSRKMKTQDNRVTAQPYALVISEEIVRTGLDLACADHTCVVFDGDVFLTYQAFIDFLAENDFIDALAEIEAAGECTSIFDLRFLDAHHFNALDLEFSGYDKERVADATNCGRLQGNFFLTKDAAEDFIKSNRHNLSAPMSYGVHLYRNPEMEMLYQIIHQLARS